MALAYGTSLRVGDYMCESEEQGVTCLEVGTGDSFFIAKDRYSIDTT